MYLRESVSPTVPSTGDGFLVCFQWGHSPEQKRGLLDISRPCCASVRSILDISQMRQCYYRSFAPFVFF